MSAAELREAARLMRERATKATPGPWRHESRFGQVPASVIHAAPGVLRGQRRDLPISEDTFGRDGKHIASWHPAVALAVADLLDVWVEHDLLLSSGSLADEKAAVLRLARTYLGEKP